MKRMLWLLLAVALAVTALVGIVVAVGAEDSEQVTAMPGAVTIDGQVDVSYGEPVKVLTSGDITETIYMSHDSYYLNYCGVVEGADWSTSKATTFKILVGEYSPYRSINAFEDNNEWYERCVRYSLVSDGTSVTSAAEALGVGGSALADGSYAIVYDAATDTMRYEVRMLKSQMSDSHTSGKVVVSSSITLADGATTVDWYNTAKTKSMAAYDGIGDGKDWQSICATVTFGSEPSELVLARKATMTIDGVKEDGYGDPYKTVTVDGVSAKMYLRHDDNYLYYCAVVNGADWSTSKNTTLNMLVGEYSPYRSINAFKWENVYYERSIKYTLASDGVNLTSTASALGMASSTPLGDSDYAIVENQGVMTYEARLPRSQMGGTYDANNQVFSAGITLPDGTKLQWHDTADRKDMGPWEGIGLGNDWLNTGATVKFTGETIPCSLTT